MSQGRGLFQRGGKKDALEKGKAILSRGLLSTPPCRRGVEEEEEGRVGRRREKMKTCEYLCYLQSKPIHYFARSVRLSQNDSHPNGPARVGGGNSRSPLSCSTLASVDVPLSTFHSAEKEREFLCLSELFHHTHA